MAAQEAVAADFNEAALHISLAAIAQRSRVRQEGIHAAIARGWREAVGESLADGILTQEEETRLRAFRDRLALDSDGSSDDTLAEPERAVRDRLVLKRQAESHPVAARRDSTSAARRRPPAPARNWTSGV